MYRDFFVASEILESTSAYEVVKLLDKLCPETIESIELFSPAQRADKIKASVLLIHGKNDSTVPHQQAETMHYNILNAGGDSTLMSLDKIGHDFLLTHLKKVYAFLREKGVISAADTPLNERKEVAATYQ